jgi:hypothetical protein
MSFNFNDLNVQLVPDLQQLCIQHTLIGCYCLSRPNQSIICDCLSKPASVICQCVSLPHTLVACQCLSKPASVVCACLSNVLTNCHCLTQNHTFCICNSLPIASYPIRWDEFEQLRTQLNEVLKQVDIQQKAAVPQTEAAFETQAQDLKRQLEAVEKQRDDFRKSTGGGNAPAGKK